MECHREVLELHIYYLFAYTWQSYVLLVIIYLLCQLHIEDCTNYLLIVG